jgi:transcriptional regulator with XRE-family HTH domain
MTNRNIILGNSIKKIRQAEGLTQVELAERISKTQSYVHQVEGGSIGYLGFSKILEELGYTYNIQLIKQKKSVEEVHI